MKRRTAAKIEADASGPLVAHVFKTTADPFVGKLSYFKVVRGTLKADSQVLNASKSQDERIGQIFVPLGKSQQAADSLAAGDIGAVSKLTATVTGDTLCVKDEPVKLSTIEFPQPLFSAAITPKGKADVDKMASSLARLTEEDPTLSLTRSPDTAETLLSGIGETHIDVALEKVKRKFGVELFSNLPKVPYKETVSSSIKTEYRHKKQTGGHGPVWARDDRVAAAAQGFRLRVCRYGGGRQRAQRVHTIGAEGRRQIAG